jgi:large subunit ribosomal protein L25
MSSDKITVTLEKREVIGKGLAKVRSEGHVPAVIHNHGSDSIHVMGEFVAMNKVYAAAGKHHPVELKVDGKQHLALIKDVDFEPTKHRMRHVVFQAIRQNEEVEAEIPVVFADVDIPAERVSLLVLKQLDHVQVKALPKNLPDELVVDPSTLAEVGDHLTVADLTAPEGVTILTPEDASLAVVEMPKDQIAEANAAQEALAEDAGTTAEPEAEEKTEDSGEEE